MISPLESQKSIHAIPMKYPFSLIFGIYGYRKTNKTDVEKSMVFIGKSSNVGIPQCHVYRPPVITIFIGGMLTIPMAGKNGMVLPTKKPPC